MSSNPVLDSQNHRRLSGQLDEGAMCTNSHSAVGANEKPSKCKDIMLYTCKMFQYPAIICEFIDINRYSVNRNKCSFWKEFISKFSNQTGNETR